MNSAEFIKFLIIAVLTSAMVFGLINLFLPLNPYLDLLGWSILFFVILAVIAFVAAARSIKNNKSQQFIGLVIFNVFIKMLVSFALIATYVRFNAPADKFFVVPFLTTYLIFTALETYFLMAQAQGVK